MSHYFLVTIPYVVNLFLTDNLRIQSKFEFIGIPAVLFHTHRIRSLESVSHKSAQYIK